MKVMMSMQMRCMRPAAAEVPPYLLLDLLSPHLLPVAAVDVDPADDVAVAGEDAERPEKKRRVTRKITPRIFADVSPDGKRATCLLGCLTPENSALYSYSATSSSTILRHCQSKHPTSFKKYGQAQNNEYNIATLKEEVQAAMEKAQAEILKRQQHVDKFFRKLDKNLSKKVRADLKALLWAIANGISRNALNCALFDSFLAELGVNPVANRHDLQADYLPQLNVLVLEHVKARLKMVRSVCASSDGWRDLLSRNWIDLALAWIEAVDGKWVLEVVDIDLIFLPGQINGDVIESAVRESIDQFVPPECLIATSTNDGAGDEQKAAFQLVQDGNGVWCAAHRVQLAVHDCLDAKKKAPPADCAPFRAVLKKAHDLVVFINGHRDAQSRFVELAAEKLRQPDAAHHWDKLVLDNDTRWDSYLRMIEHVVYFDVELTNLLTDGALGIPVECIFSAAEFDLAYALTLVLPPIREFTKFVQYRNKITLAHLPGLLDSLLGKILPGVFDPALGRRADGTLAHLHALQRLLAASVRERFADVFEGRSLALAARYFLPGEHPFRFAHFPLEQAALTEQVEEHLVADYLNLLSADTPPAALELHRGIATNQVRMARMLLAPLGEETDPLIWWPQQIGLGALFPLAMMLFAIPASSADNERSFSSAGLTLGSRRSRLELEAFRMEHRIRRFLVAGTNGATQEGRQERLNRVARILDRFGDLVAARAAGQQ
jgi:hypothetical protein